MPKTKRPKVSPEPSPVTRDREGHATQAMEVAEKEDAGVQEVLAGNAVKVFWPKYSRNYTGRVVKGTKASSLIFYKDGSGKIRLAWPPRRWSPQSDKRQNLCVSLSLSL